jgi:hypothetical protein
MPTSIFSALNLCKGSTLIPSMLGIFPTVKSLLNFFVVGLWALGRVCGLHPLGHPLGGAGGRSALLASLLGACRSVHT